MTGFEIFHTVLFIIFGITSLCEVKGEKNPRKYINLGIGILAILIALYDIIVTGLGIKIF
jgi:hypothetical protein